MTKMTKLHEMPFLNVARWVAALLVVVSHARALLLVDYPKIHSPSILVKAIYFITGFGHEAVVVFFVISGFLVGGVSLNRWLRTRTVAAADYALSRTARIYAVLIPALVIGGSLDEIGSRWFDASHLYSEPAAAMTDNSVNEALGWLNLVGNVLQVQGLAIPMLGSNVPLWSLAYEWWYYVLFLLAAVAFLKPTLARTTVAGCCFIALAWLLPVKVLLWGSFWLLGLGLYFVVDRSRTKIHPVIGLAAFTFAMLWTRTHRINGDAPMSSSQFYSDALVAVGFSVMLMSMAKQYFGRASTAFHRHMADFSYSTYLIHFPVLVLVASASKQMLQGPLNSTPDVKALSFLALVIIFLYGVSYAFSLATERKTGAVRMLLSTLRKRCLCTDTKANS